VQTRSNFEKKVGEELRAKNVEAYLPVVRQVHRWKDRNKELNVPLFPGYIFVRMAACDASRLQVLRTGGAVRILGNGRTIEPIPECEIDAVRRLIHSKLPFATHAFIREGDLVRVRRGPLAGVEGLLLRIKSQHRLIISVNILCQSVATEVDAGNVEPIRHPAHSR
jgi:transcription antitermination factor NusG